MIQQNMPVPNRETSEAARGVPDPAPTGGPAMLSPTAAWRSLCARTGGIIALVTFYRWLRSGKIYSIRLGQKIFIPREALDDLIKNCLDGERF